MEHNPCLEDTLEAFLLEDEPTSIMSIQALRAKLAESMIPEPPETMPSCPDALRAQRPVSGTRPKLTLGSYFKVELRRRAGR